MSLSWLWPWRKRRGQPPQPGPLSRSARGSLTHRARLSVESLEDRAVPSVTPADTIHDIWRNQRFQVDDVALSTRTADVSTSATTAVNNSFGSVIGLDKAFTDYSYRGKGYSVAVIDTGIDYTHVDLGGGWGKRVVAGWDFVNNDSDPMDDNGHGTHVAGIIGSSSATYSGVAPDVNLVALKVLDANGSGSFGAVEDALKWVVANRAKYNIVAVNFSLGSGNYVSNPFTFLDDELTSLKSQGVFIAVAAGNNFYGSGSQQGLAFPAIDPNVVSVGAVWDGNYGNVGFASGARDYTTAPDRVASFSQRYVNLGIMAPGALVTSTYLHGGYQQMAGTSMASPVVAGAAVLLHQALDAAGKPASEDGMLALMRSTGVSVVDGDDENDNVTNTGLSFKRLDVNAALHAISAPTVVSNVPPTLSPISNQSLVPGGSLLITLNATDANNDPITFSARIPNAPVGANPAYQLKQSLGLTYAGSYYQNTWGLNEKWLLGSGGTYYAILPNGQLRRWAGDVNTTMSAANLITTLAVSFYNDPSLLWNAQPGSGGTSPVSVSLTGNRLTVQADPSYTGSFQVEVTASDGKANSVQTFTVTVAKPTAPNQPPVWTAIPNQSVSQRKGQLTVNLTATDPEGQPLSFSVRAIGGPAGLGLAVQGNQLVVTQPKGYLGTFTVEATASDGQLSAVTSFQVTVTNVAPTIGDLANVTVPRGQNKISVNIPIQDADGDPLNLSVRVSAIDGLAYQVSQQLNLSFAGSYYTNFLGQKEKWLISKDYRTWYAILPNGELRRLGNTLADLMKPESLVATLSPTYYADPSLLWNAQPTKPPRGNLSFQGSQLNLELQEEFLGTLTLEVSVSDGVNVTKKTFKVTFN